MGAERTRQVECAGAGVQPRLVGQARAGAEQRHARGRTAERGESTGGDPDQLVVGSWPRCRTVPDATARGPTARGPSERRASRSSIAAATAIARSSPSGRASPSRRCSLCPRSMARTVPSYVHRGPGLGQAGRPRRRPRRRRVRVKPLGARPAQQATSAGAPHTRAAEEQVTGGVEHSVSRSATPSGRQPPRCVLWITPRTSGGAGPRWGPGRSGRAARCPARCR